MARGPRNLRTDLQNARSFENSKELLNVGAKVIAKSNSCALLRNSNTISRGSSDGDGGCGDSSGGLSEAGLVRLELAEQTKALRTLQRNYDNVSKLAAGDRAELAAIQKARGDNEKEEHALQHENDRLTKALAIEAAARQSIAEQLEAARRGGVEKKPSKEDSDALRTAQEQAKRLQTALQKEQASGRTLNQQLLDFRKGGKDKNNELEQARESLKRKEHLLIEAEAQIATLEKRLDAQLLNANELKTKLEVAQQQQGKQQSVAKLEQEHAEALETLRKELASERYLRECAETQFRETQAALNQAHDLHMSLEATLTQKEDDLEKLSLQTMQAIEKAAAARLACEEMQGLREGVDSLSAGNAALESRLAEADSQRAAASGELEGLRGQLSTARRAEKVAREAAQYAEMLAEKRATSVAKLETTVAELTSKHGCARDLEEAMREKMRASKDRCEEMAAEVKRWSEKATKLESDHGTACARLRRAEANIELLQSQFEESKSEVTALQGDLEDKERRLLDHTSA